MINNRNVLILGDIFSILAVTLIGFATHGELNTSFLTRIAAIFFPLVIAWFLIAPWFGLFQREVVSNPKQFWRPMLAMILNAAIIPIFVVVLGATSALGMVLWRGIYFLLNRKVR